MGTKSQFAQSCPQMILFNRVEVIFTVKIMLNVLIEPIVTNISELTVKILKIYTLKSIFEKVVFTRISTRISCNVGFPRHKIRCLNQDIAENVIFRLYELCHCDTFFFYYFPFFHYWWDNLDQILIKGGRGWGQVCVVLNTPNSSTFLKNYHDIVMSFSGITKRVKGCIAYDNHII